MEDNLIIYNQVKEVPETAKKPITGGRLSGMTDIKPMWRIQKLTEVFGPCGIGWYTKTTNKQIIDGANKEKIALVDIELFVNYKKPLELEEDKWGVGIEGSGGSSFISKEKNGYYTSDECFKMAYTDALSVACKSLGVAADVYWNNNETKYNAQPEEVTEETAKEYVFTFGKHKGEKLIDLIENGDKYIDWYLNKCEKPDPSIIKMIELLTGEKAMTEEQKDQHLEDTQELMKLITQYNVDIETVCAGYGVERITDLSAEQYNQCVRGLKKRYEVK